MEHSAWLDISFDYPRDVPTMISAEERRYLYWLGRTVWSGAGNVVEIGPWLGGSTVCLAAGMRDSGRDATGRLHVFDNFIWRDFMAARAPLGVAAGESFEPFFRQNTAAFADIVVPSARALPDEAIDGDTEAAGKRFTAGEDVAPLDALPEGDVDILFIDGAKSWRGMCHLLRIARDRLVPGKSMLVCQDYKYWGTYWVPLVMSRIGAHVTPVHNNLTSTTVTFRVDTPIPESIVGGFESHVRDIDTSSALDGIDAAAALLDADGDAGGAATVRLAQVAFLSHQNRVEEAARALARCEASWPFMLGHYQLERARGYLRMERGRPVPPGLRLRASRLTQRIARKFRRRSLAFRSPRVAARPQRERPAPGTPRRPTSYVNVSRPDRVLFRPPEPKEQPCVEAGFCISSSRS